LAAELAPGLHRPHGLILGSAVDARAAIQCAAVKSSGRSIAGAGSLLALAGSYGGPVHSCARSACPGNIRDRTSDSRPGASSFHRKLGVLADVRSMKPCIMLSFVAAGVGRAILVLPSPYRKLPGSATRGYECRHPTLGMSTQGNFVFSSRSAAAASVDSGRERTWTLFTRDAAAWTWTRRASLPPR
jgi:hypothetical protein